MHVSVHSSRWTRSVIRWIQARFDITFDLTGFALSDREVNLDLAAGRD